MSIQSRLILAVLFLSSVLPVWAAELIVVYPKIYDKRTAYYDSLASQLKADFNGKLAVIEPEQLQTSQKHLALGGTELFFHGYQSQPVAVDAQVKQLKKRFPVTSRMHLVYASEDKTNAAKIKQLAEQSAMKVSEHQGNGNGGIVTKFASLLGGSSDGSITFWLPGRFVSNDSGSAFRRLLMMIWDKQLAVISAGAPQPGNDFVFTLITNDQAFSSRLSAAMKNDNDSLFVMMPPKKPQTLTVIYPKVKAPHNAVFEQIIDGIKQQFGGSVNLIAISRKDDRAAVAATIDRDRPDMVITLSRTGKSVAKLMKVKVPWVAGAARLEPNEISGISPGGSPSLILNYLNDLAPEVKRVQVVYSKGSQWLIDLADNAAAQYGLQLVGHRVNNRKEAILKYTELFKKTDYKTDAFWLPYDNVTSSNKYILPLVLDASWEKRFVVISSIPPHAKRGALLSLYPNNVTTGVDLVKMVDEMFTRSTKGVVVPTAQVLLAVNLRTASHLGLEYTSKQKGQFDFTFPSR